MEWDVVTEGVGSMGRHYSKLCLKNLGQSLIEPVMNLAKTKSKGAGEFHSSSMSSTRNVALGGTLHVL